MHPPRSMDTLYYARNAVEALHTQWVTIARGQGGGRRAVLCLSPEGRGAAECVVTVPNEFTKRIPPPGEDDFRSLEQISARAITPK